jgi:hypothetical protein
VFFAFFLRLAAMLTVAVLIVGCEPTGAECGDGVYSPELGEECDYSAPYEGAEELVCPFDHICMNCECVQRMCTVDGDCDLLRESPASCPDDCYCGDGEISEMWGFEECEADSDCPAGETCINCQCEPPGSCGDGVYSPELGEECDYTAPYEGAEELVCPFDHICMNCECVQRMCTVDGDCDLLRESPASCPDDCYCGDGEVSEMWGFEECEADSDCPPGDMCVDCLCESGAGACGDGTCDVATENTDLCPADCVCVNDGACSPGEGTGCADCGDLVAACGTPCNTSDECREELSCFNAVCWDACICEGNCGGQESGGGTCGSPCTSVSDCGSDTCVCDNGCCSCP